MADMAQCPYCFRPLRPADLVQGKEATCPRCKYPLAVLFEPVETGARRRARTFDPLTAAAFAFGSFAVLIASFPAISFLSKLLSLLGLVLATAAVLISGSKDESRRTLPFAVAGLCLLALVFFGPWPRFGGANTPQRLAVPLTQSGLAANQPLPDDDWVDARNNAIMADHVRVQVVSVRLGRVELSHAGKESLSDEEQLAIRLRLSYQGVIFRQIPYEPWSDRGNARSKHPAGLVDNLNQTYEQKRFPPGWKPVGQRDRDAMTPGHQVIDVLVFPAPTHEVEYLRLTLPASAFGAPGEVRFQLPRSMITKS